MNPPRTVTFRPVDLAREHGLSTQAVRNYEDQGVLPAAERTEAGYRVYTPHHVASLRAFLALVRAHGYAVAGQDMRAVHRGDLGEAFEALDASHAQLAADRATLRAVRSASEYLREPVEEGWRGDFSIGDLAAWLGVSRATLRGWERAGILEPARERGTGHRTYDAAQVRDAEFARMLRRGGYGLGEIATVLGQVRAVGQGASGDSLAATLDGWEERLVGQGVAMLRAAGALESK
ncbi:MAG: MerR family transcriptional regulator [Propionibacteriaceae bacterium]|nr:MerR family transcriptional regulator [Propionibacteriaceae bacterium]